MSKGWTPSCPVLIWSCVTAMIEGHVGRGDSVSKESESVKGVKNSQLISTTCGSMLGIWVDTMK